MLVSDFILSYLQKKKVKKVFLLTGGAIAFVVDAFSRNKKITYISTAHEQAAAMMADAYSRLGPNLGATMVTSGPGATNLLTGIACSWFDSVPTMHICGQVNRHEQIGHVKSTKHVRQVGFQETDIVSMSKPITKFSYRVKNENEIKYSLDKAYHISQSGRAGPVLLDIPMDIQRKKYVSTKQKIFKIKSKVTKKYLILEKIKKIRNKLENSKRPCMIIGGGIRLSKTNLELKTLIKKLKIPVLTTWSGFDSVSYSNPYYIGSIGVYGSRAANFTVQNSDFILCLGSRLDTRITGGNPSKFARAAYIAAIDIDKNELNKSRGLNIDLKINCDLKYFFKFSKKLHTKPLLKNRNWLNLSKNWKHRYKSIQSDFYKDKKFVNPYIFMKKLSYFLGKNETIITDDGAHLTWTMQGFEIKEGQRLFSAFGNSPMGYAFPAAIGASIALNKKRIICIDGDGSIQINIQELHTMVNHKLPIKIFILNNNGYGIIKQFQELYLNKRYEATGKGVSNPNFKDIANAYKINYNLINNNNKINSVLKKVLNSNSAEFIEVMIRNNQKIIPKLSFGDPIEDLSPKVSRKEFKSNMIIDEVEKSNIIESN
tara:strand:- start:433 stop:2226 length:1794 start_codon:yes stop_codon:yes gene_type:complete